MSLLRGRFDSPAGDDMIRFSSSLAQDLRLLDEDVRGSIAHVTMLGEVGILGAEEVQCLQRGLSEVQRQIRDGEWTPGAELEDLHMAIESRLTEQVGEVARKLHTARSRNDQVATDVRLWLKRALVDLDRALGALLDALLERIERDGRTLMPGYTHLQRGQPILLGHHLLGHAWPLVRDRERLGQAARRADRSPLGACALAGTSQRIDRHRTAELLGFGGIVENAMDAVAARDHLQEVVADCAIAMTHLSRMAEDLVLWSSAEFAFVRLGDGYTTGSSIMPQKRNPDAPELVRGKTGRVIGDLVALLTLLKGLPLAYNRDLQEDKVSLFDAVDTTRDSLEIMAGVWRTLRFDAGRFETALAGDASLATELADHLASGGLAFRDAHEIVARLVRWCEQQGKTFDRVTPAEAAEFHPRLAAAIGQAIDPRAAAERRTSAGGTAWSEIERQLALLREDRRRP